MKLYEIIANGKHSYLWAYTLTAAYHGVKMWYLPGTQITIISPDGTRHNFTNGNEDDNSAR